ncbi:MAG: hypothetical protein RLO50_06215 [Azospirillaceae bacterium]
MAGRAVPLWNGDDTRILAGLWRDRRVVADPSEAVWEAHAARSADRRMASTHARREVAKVALLTADWTDCLPAERVVRAGLTAEKLRWLQALRCHQPGGWEPATRVEGDDALRHVLAAGRGAILWVPSLAFASLAGKLSLHRAGFRVSHLSRWYHGPSDTRLGIRFLNRYQVAAEAPLLAERLVVGRSGNAGPVLRTLAARLRAGRPVSVTFGHQGLSCLDLPFLTGVKTVATGPLKLARLTGAPMFTVWTERTGEGVYETRVEPLFDPRLDSRGSANGSGDSEAAIVGRVLEGLAERVRRLPGQVFWRDDVARPRAVVGTDGTAGALSREDAAPAGRERLPADQL